MKYYWITAIAFLAVLTVCSCLEVRSKRNRKTQNEKRWLTQLSGFPFLQITNYPICAIAICSLFFCAVIFVVEAWIEGIPLDDSSTILMCLTVIGFIGTIIGLIITYMQLKRYNNQFFGYYDFYRIAQEMLELNKKRCIKFYFSTPIPGHIAYGNDQVFKKFLESLFNYNGKIEYIIPTEQNLKQFYEPYKDQTIRNVKYTEEIINRLFTCQPGRKASDELDLATFVKKLREKDDATIYTYSASNGREPESIENLYLSDGNIAIYAIPLHYLILQDASVDANGKSDPRPVLVGFTTTDRALVTSLEEYFNRIKDDDKCKVLQKDQRYLQ